jgi:exopolysaccharide biosynthesis polyprenyl glycosylphosphotransferase
MISLERKRTERTRKPFLLMLLDAGGDRLSQKNGEFFNNILAVLLASTRETDATGWYKDRTVVGVVFSELMIDNKNSILSTMLARVSSALRDSMTLEQFNRMSISFHLFPDDWDQDQPQRPSNPTLYPDLLRRDHAKKFPSSVKRMMDVLGSTLALTICAPLFLVIALAIKVSSKGPVFFRQQRIGQHGVPFVFLKFRSMLVDSDHAVHRDYVRRFIAGQVEQQASKGNAETIYKLTNDDRVTRLGALLRRTSLDELPQFINVLKGEMSLVGPRPALPYELAAYQTWHRRRILEVKPGITGLWQVNGRSRVEFDEMVRLDLKYAKAWSPWLDIKILLRTPWAVLMGEGAY